MQLSLDFDARSAALDALHEATGIFTKTPVVEGLLDRLGWPATGGRLLDPSAGDGSFLVSALSRLTTPPGGLDEVRRVCGWEIHPLAVQCAREAISNLLIGRGWCEQSAIEAAREVVIEGDFLLDPTVSANRFTTIAGNPPYLRFANVPTLFRDAYSVAVADYARADMLHAFLDRCVQILPEDGKIGLISADRWLFNSTAAKLRSEVGRRVGMVHLTRVDASGAFYRPKYRKAGSPPRIHPVELVLSPAARHSWPIGPEPIRPGCATDEPTSLRLEQCATIRLAPWLGPHGLFVLDDAAAATIPPAERIPAIDTDDIEPGADRLQSPRRWALLTERNRNPSEAVDLHLRRNQHLTPAKCQGKPYWLPPERITLDVRQPSLLIPRITRQLRVIELPAGILPINHNLQVVSASETVSLEELREYLLSEVAQTWIRDRAPRLENGFLSITTTLLRSMPVPEHWDRTESIPCT